MLDNLKRPRKWIEAEKTCFPVGSIWSYLTKRGNTLEFQTFLCPAVTPSAWITASSRENAPREGQSEKMRETWAELSLTSVHFIFPWKFRRIPSKRWKGTGIFDLEVSSAFHRLPKFTLNSSTFSTTDPPKYFESRRKIVSWRSKIFLRRRCIVRYLNDFPSFLP